MWKKYKGYFIFLGALISIFLGFYIFRSHQYDWTITYLKSDKNPFGAYVLHNLLDSSWSQSYHNSYLTISELNDNVSGNALILCEQFDGSESVLSSLSEMVDNERVVMIAAGRFMGDIADSLGLGGTFFDRYLENFSPLGTDSTGLKLAGSNKVYYYPGGVANRYFSNLKIEEIEVIAENERGNPVLIALGKGKGKLYLCAVPLIFSNYGLLKNDNIEFAEQILAHLTNENLNWTSYYHGGRPESKSPVRFILSQKPLRWAYYTLLAIILLAMTFGARRRQAIIPVVERYSNTTVDFISTVGNLYYRKANHKDLASKKIAQMRDHLSIKHFIHENTSRADTVKKLMSDSGMGKDEVEALLQKIDAIEASDYIDASTLIKINKQINRIVNTQ